MGRGGALCVGLPPAEELGGWEADAADPSLVWQLALYAGGPPAPGDAEASLAARLTEDVVVPVATGGGSPASATAGARLLEASFASDDSVLDDGDAPAAPSAAGRTRTLVLPLDCDAAGGRVTLRVQLAAHGAVLAEQTIPVLLAGDAAGSDGAAGARRRDDALLRPWAGAPVPLALAAADGSGDVPESAGALTLTWVPAAAAAAAAPGSASASPSPPPATRPLSLCADDLSAPLEARRRDVYVAVQGALPLPQPAAPTRGGRQPSSLPPHLASYTVTVALCRGSGELLTPPQVVGAALRTSEPVAAAAAPGGDGTGWTCDWRYTARLELPADAFQGSGDDTDGSGGEPSHQLDRDLHLLFYVLTPPAPAAAGGFGSAQQQATSGLPVVAAFAYLHLWDDPPARHAAPAAATTLSARLRPAPAAADSSAPVRRQPAFLADRRHDHAAHGTTAAPVPPQRAAPVTGDALTSTPDAADGGVLVGATLRLYAGSPPFLPAATSTAGGAPSASASFLASSALSVSAPMFAASPAAAPVGGDTLSASPAAFPVPPHLQMLTPVPPAPDGAAPSVATAQADGAWPVALRVALRVVASEPDVQSASAAAAGASSWGALLSAIDRDDAAAEAAAAAGAATSPSASSVAALLTQLASAAAAATGADAAAAASGGGAAGTPALARYRALTGGGTQPPHTALSVLSAAADGSAALPSLPDVLKQHQPVLAALIRQYTGGVAVLAAPPAGADSDAAAAARYQAALVEAPPPMLVQSLASLLVPGGSSPSNGAGAQLPLARTLPLAAAVVSAVDVLSCLARAQAGLLQTAAGANGGAALDTSASSGYGSPGDRRAAAAAAAAATSSQAALFAPGALPALAADIDTGLFGELVAGTAGSGSPGGGDDDDGGAGASFVPGLLTPGALAALLAVCEAATTAAARAVSAALAQQQHASPAPAGGAVAAAALASSVASLAHWTQAWAALLSLTLVHVARTRELLGVWAELPPLEDDELGLALPAAGLPPSLPFASDPPSHARRSLFAFLSTAAWALALLRGAGSEAASAAHAALATGLATAPAGSGPWALLPALLAAASAAGVIPAAAANGGAPAAQALSSLVLALCLPAPACDVTADGGGDACLSHVRSDVLPLFGLADDASSSASAGDDGLAPPPTPGGSLLARYRPASLLAGSASARGGAVAPLASVMAASQALAASMALATPGKPRGGLFASQLSALSSTTGRPGAPSSALTSRYPALLTALTSTPPPRVRLRAAGKGAAARRAVASPAALALAASVAASAAAALLRHTTPAGGASASAPLDVESPHAQRLLAAYSGGLTLVLRAAAAERAATRSGSPVAGLPLPAAVALAALPRISAALSPAVGAAVLGALLPLTAATATEHGESWDLPLQLLTIHRLARWAGGSDGSDSGIATPSPMAALPQPLTASLLSASAEALAATGRLRLQAAPAVAALATLVRRLRAREARGDSPHSGVHDLLGSLPQAVPLALFLHAQAQGFGSSGSATGGGDDDDDEGLLDGASASLLGATGLLAGSPGSGSDGGSSPGGDAATNAFGTSLASLCSAAAAALAAGQAGDGEAAMPLTSSPASALADLTAVMEAATGATDAAEAAPPAPKSSLGRAAAALLATARTLPAASPTAAVAAGALLRCLLVLLGQTRSGGGAVTPAVTARLATVCLSLATAGGPAMAAAAGDVLAALLAAEQQPQRSSSPSGATDALSSPSPAGAAELALVRAGLAVAASALAQHHGPFVGVTDPAQAQPQSVTAAAVLAVFARVAASPGASARLAGLHSALAFVASPSVPAASGGSLAGAQAIRSLLSLAAHTTASAGGVADGPTALAALSLWRALAAAHGWRGPASSFELVPASAQQRLLMPADGSDTASASVAPTTGVDHASAARALVATAQLAIALAADDAPTAAALAGLPAAACLGLTSHTALVAFAETAASSAYACAVRVGDWQLASTAARLLLAVYRSLVAATPGLGSSARGFRRAGAGGTVAWNDWGWWERAPASPPGVPAGSDDGPVLSLTKAASAMAAAAAAAQPPQPPAALQLQTRAAVSAVAAQLAHEVLAAAARATLPRPSRRHGSGDDAGGEDDAPPTGPVTMPLPPYVTDAVSQLDGGVMASLQAGGNGDDGAGDAGAALRAAAALCCAGIVAPQPHAPAFALVGARGAVPGFGSAAAGGSEWTWAVLKLPPGTTVADAVGSLRAAFVGAADGAGRDVPVHGPEVPVLASEQRTVTVTHVLQAVDPAAAGLPPGLPSHFAGAFGSGRYGGLAAGPRFALVPVEAASSQWGLLGAGSTAAAALAAAESGSASTPATAVPPAVHVWPLLEVPDSDDVAAAPPHGFIVGASDRHLPQRPHGASRLRAWAVRSATAVTTVVTEPAAAGGGNATTTTVRRSLAPQAVSALGAPLLLGGKYDLRKHGNPDKLLRDDGSAGGSKGGEDGAAVASSAAGAGAHPDEAPSSTSADEQLAELLQRQQDGGDGANDGVDAGAMVRAADSRKPGASSSAPSSSTSPLLMIDVLLPAAALAGDAPGAADADEGAVTWGLPQMAAPAARRFGGGTGVAVPLPQADVWSTRLAPLPAASTVTIVPVPLAAGLTQLLRLSASTAAGALRTLLGATWVVDGLPPVAVPPPVTGSYYHYHHQRAPVRPSAEDDASLLLGGPALRFDAGGAIPSPPSTIQPASGSDGSGYGGGGSSGSAARDLDAVQLAPLTVADAFPLALLLGLQNVDGSVEALPAASLLPGVASKASAGGGASDGAATADVPPLEHDATAACARLHHAAKEALRLAPGGADAGRTVVPLDDPASVALVYALAAASAPPAALGVAPASPTPLLVSAVTSPGPLLTPASAAALLAALTPSPTSWLPLLSSARVLLTDYAELKAMWREKRVTQLRRAWIREDEALAAAGYDTTDRAVPDFAALLPRKPHRAALALDAAVCGGLAAAGALAAAVEAVPRADGGSGAGRARAVGAFNAAFDGTAT